MHSVLGVFTLMVFIQCGERPFYENSTAIVDQEWSSDDKVTYTFAIEDTLAFYDFYMDLRTTTSYEWANLYLFVDMESPNNMIYRDTVELPLADPTGRWYGKNSGSMVENRVLFFKNVNFDLPGEYSISFTQAMRQDPLPHIADVGLRIEEVKDKRKK
jgi:gliding motility-associated lipoprotein GldH